MVLPKFGDYMNRQEDIQTRARERFYLASRIMENVEAMKAPSDQEVRRALSVSTSPATNYEVLSHDGADIVHVKLGCVKSYITENMGVEGRIEALERVDEMLKKIEGRGMKREEYHEIRRIPIEVLAKQIYSEATENLVPF